jgi:tRNA A64-2'-O-ribosylphosphate transferase
LDLVGLKTRLSKPMQPLWVVRQSMLPDTAPRYEDCHHLILCTASRRVRGAEASDGGYIQGAGDDSEAWAKVCKPFCCGSFEAHVSRD